MRRFNKLLKSGTSLMLVFAMLLGMCSTAVAVGDSESNGGYVALGDFVTVDALADFKDGTVLGGGFMRVADLYDKLVANQNAIANADVIALGIGNADINIYTVNNILGTIGSSVVDGFTSLHVDTAWENLENALANCDGMTRSIALQLYDKLEPVVSEKLSDNAMIATVVDVLVYTAVSFMVNYSAMLEEIATVNEDTTVIIVGLVNMMDGMKVNFNGQELDLGLYIGYVMEALNGYLAAVPTMMQMNGDYENVTFLYAEATDVEVEYVKPALTEKLRESIIAVVNEMVLGTLVEALQEKINAVEVPGYEDVEIKITLCDEIDADMVENYEKDALTDAGEIIACAVYIAFEKALLDAKEPDVLSLDMANADLGSLVNVEDMDLEFTDDELSDLTDKVEAEVLAIYGDWQEDEGQTITKDCYDFMMGKVEETVKATVKDYQVDMDGEKLTILDAYAAALNTVVSAANAEGLELEEIAIEDIDWDALYASMIGEGNALAMFQSYLPTVTEEKLITVATDKLNSKEGQAEIKKNILDTFRKDNPEYSEWSDDDILAVIEELTEKTFEELMSDATEDAKNDIPDKVAETLSQLWAAADEKLSTLYTTVKNGHDEAMDKAEEELKPYKEKLPLALLEIADDFVDLPGEGAELNIQAWVDEMRAKFADTHVGTVEALFDEWVNAAVNPAAADLAVGKIDAVLPRVFEGDDINSLLYLLGRLLVGDGLGRYVTDEGTEAIRAAMVAAYYGDGEDDTQNTVQNEISNKVEKLIDLVLQYGPKAMNKVGAIEKLRSALNVMVDKLDGRGGPKVDKAVSEIESILDEIEAIAKGQSNQTAEDLVNAYIDLDATIEELRALIQGEKIPEDSKGAIREFIDAAAHGDYEIDYESYYVAIGDSSVEGYAGLLADELGLSNDYDTVVSEDVATSIENLDAEVIAQADLITVGFSGNTFFKYMASQVNAHLRSNEEPQEMDWTTYVGKAGVKYVEKALNEIQVILAKDLHDNIASYGYVDEILMLAIESYAYAIADYVFNYPALIEAIREINSDALIVSVGMNNALAGMTVDISEVAEGYEFALGEYVEYLIAAVNGEAKIFAMLNENMAYVHAPDVTIEADVEEKYDYYDNMGIYDFMLEIGTIERGGFAGLETADEGNDYIKNQIYNALNITHGLRLGDVDLDGDVDWADLAMMYDHTMQWYELTGEQLYVANLDGDPEVTFVDVAILYDYLMEWNTILD